MGSGSSPARASGGGLNPGDILSERDMISERGNNRESVDAALTVARSVADTYGEGAVVDQLLIGEIKDGSVLGYYKRGDKTISIAEGFMDDQKMTSAYDKCVEEKYHPPRGDKSGTEAVVAHEYGHALNDKVAQKMGVDMDTAASRIVKEAKKNVKTESGKVKHRGIVQFERAISGYATSSETETIAEAFSDVYCNGNNAKAESKAVMKVIDSYMK